jgi:hypothetical protein
MVYCALCRNFVMAAIWAALASATRVAGVFLVVLLSIEFIQANGWRALFTRRVWPLALAPFGALAFFLYHWIAFGNFFLFLRVQNSFGRDFGMAVSNYFLIRNNPDMVHTLLDLSFTAAAIILGFFALRQFRLSYGVYMLVSLAIELSSGTPLGIARYSMVLFPIYLTAARIRSPVGRSAWLFGSVLLLAFNIIRFVNHYWSG